MSSSHNENTLYVNGKILKNSYDQLLQKWDKIMVDRPQSVIAGDRAKELEQLTKLDSIALPSIGQHFSNSE